MEKKDENSKKIKTSKNKEEFNTNKLSDRAVRLYKSAGYKIIFEETPTEPTIYVRFDGSEEILLPPKDYDKMKSLPSGREVKEEHEKAIEESYEEFGIMSRPLLALEEETGNLNKVDGNHRFKTLEKRKSGLISMLYRGNNASELMATINNTQSPWTLLWHIKSYSKDVKLPNQKEYIVLLSEIEEANRIKKESKINVKSGLEEYQTAIQEVLVCAIFLRKNRQIATKFVKSGKYVIVDFENGKQLMQKLYDCHKAGISCTRKVNQALIDFIRDKNDKGQYDHKRMLKNIRATILKSENKIILFPENESEIENIFYNIYDGNKTKSLLDNSTNSKIGKR